MKVLSTVINAMLWNLWEARNDRVFLNNFIQPRAIVLAVAADLDLWKHRTNQVSAKESLVVQSDYFREIAT
jgi:hypothetical protein